MTNYLLLQAAGPGSGLSMIFLPLILLVFLVFFVYIPQNQQKKQQQKLLSSLKEGMDVYTNSGIVGRITKIDEKTVRLMVDDKTFLRVLKSSVGGEFKG